jgi:uncharacterized membrane protein YebE (DUF533 family)
MQSPFPDAAARMTPSASRRVTTGKRFMDDSHQSKVEAMINHVIADGRLTADEKKQIDDLVLADGKLTLDERKCIDRLLAMIARGELVMED